MSRNGWDGIEVLDETPMNILDDQYSIDKYFARTFETEQGQKVLEFLISKTLAQPTWIPGSETSFGYAREGQNSIIREIQMRIARAKK